MYILKDTYSYCCMFSWHTLANTDHYTDLLINYTSCHVLIFSIDDFVYRLNVETQ